jgi:antitoxin component YwqK of YwqJK toxin-antitoxin module
MRRILILLSFLLFNSLLFSQNKIEKSFYSNGTLKSIGASINGERDGEWKLYHENGKLFQLIFFNKGNPTGSIKFFHKNGQMSLSANAINGKLEGEIKGFREDGQPSFQGNFKDGLLDGECRILDPDRSLMITGFFKNGSPWNGKFLIFDEPGPSPISQNSLEFSEGLNFYIKQTSLTDLLNSKEKRESSYLYGLLNFVKVLNSENVFGFGLSNYNNGNLEGTYIYYSDYKASKIYRKGLFANNKKVNEWTEYHFNGNLKTIGSFEDDKKTGIWLSYDKLGNIAFSANYIEGELSGKYKEKTYDPDGIEEGIYVNGKLNGEWKTYYTNGILKEIGEYVNGEKNGEWKCFYSNGAICESGFYSNGLRVGKWSLFDKSKIKIATGNYEFNERIINLSGEAHPELELSIDSISESLVKAPLLGTLTFLTSLRKSLFYYDNKLNADGSNFRSTKMAGLKEVINEYNPKFIIIKGIKSSYEDFVDVVRILNEYNIFFQVAEISEFENELVHASLHASSIE